MWAQAGRYNARITRGRKADSYSFVAAQNIMVSNLWLTVDDGLVVAWGDDLKDGDNQCPVSIQGVRESLSVSWVLAVSAS